MNGSTNAEFDFAVSEVICNFVGIPDGTGQAVELRDDEGIPRPTRGQGFAKSGAVLVCASKAVVNINSFRLNAKGRQGITLRSKVLRLGGHSRVSDQYLRHKNSVSYKTPLPVNSSDGSYGTVMEPSSQ